VTQIFFFLQKRNLRTLSVSSSSLLRSHLLFLTVYCKFSFILKLAFVSLNISKVPVVSERHYPIQLILQRGRKLFSVNAQDFRFISITMMGTQLWITFQS